MDLNDRRQLCYALAKAMNSGVRLYEGGECRYYYSVYHLHPDPAGPYLPQLLDPARSAGIFASPLQQFYAYITWEDGWRLILGPSRIGNEDPAGQEELLFLLGVEAGQREEYLRLLHCPPPITMERMGWLLSFLSLAVNHRALRPDELCVSISPGEAAAAVRQEHIRQTADLSGELSSDRHQTEYNIERLLLSYIENGEPESLQELLGAQSISGGPMADNTRRQIKNTCICAATLAARAAIAGGMDDAAAFSLSDLYIQRVELMHDIPSLERLRTELLVEFARQVEQVRYHTAPAEDGGDARIFRVCAKYVSQNLYEPIRVETMAQELGYARAYLCSRFKQQTGLTLTQYILRQKVIHAQRMLELTDKSIAEIAALYLFSSQSHFQNVFKRITGETPQAYRRRTQQGNRQK